MNREIKFRAKVNGSYVYSDSYVNIAFYFDATKGYEQEQFTGLRDKNGKEIYEGDVYITEQGVKYKIMFINGCFVGGKNENNNAPLSWCLADYKKEIIRDDFHEEIEIIGNIYENPELL